MEATSMEVEARVARLEQLVRQLWQEAAGPGPENATGAATEAQEFPTGTVITWHEFEAQCQDLSLDERLQVVEVAIGLLDEVFVHLPLKRAMLAIDPVQRLRLLRRQLQQQARPGATVESARAFHDEMIDIFHSLRDLHTVYFLPTSYHRRTAFLPFLIEAYSDAQGQRHYIVTKTRPDFSHTTFKVGVTVTHWNGIPIDRSVELNAERAAGSNVDARRARGLELLTLRPMSMSAPPDERWVVIDYDDGQPRKETFEWKVIVTHPSPNGAGAIGATSLASAGRAARAMGFDAVAERARRVRTSLFYPRDIATETTMAQAIAAGAQRGDGTARTAWGGAGLAAQNLAPEVQSLAPEVLGLSLAAQCPTLAAAERTLQAAAAVTGDTSTTSLLPEFFFFRAVSNEVGYIRIWSFMTFNANAFLAEFARIVGALGRPQLIIDVRGNGGGLIWAGEMLLQSLTAQRITPARFHFINTARTQELCRRDSELQPWTASIEESLLTSEVFSKGLPLTPPEMLAGVRQVFSGPVVLVVDALSYSTTDIFAAGFQDHGVGKILGTSGRTGAGGANVVPHDFLCGTSGFAMLPKGVNFNVALRRSTRVAGQEGVPLEGLGVVPDQIHEPTRNDILENNVDLINTAVQMLAT